MWRLCGTIIILMPAAMARLLRDLKEFGHTFRCSKRCCEFECKCMVVFINVLMKIWKPLKKNLKHCDVPSFYSLIIACI